MEGESPTRAAVRRFSLQLWGALALILVALTVAVIALARGQLLAAETAAARAQFATEARAAQALRTTRVAEWRRRVDLLATRPRLHAALEDDALDLLYLVARDELREVLHTRDAPAGRFHRFLAPDGRVLPPPPELSCGELPAGWSAAAPTPQPGWQLWIDPRDPGQAWELITTPFYSTSDRRLLGSLLVGMPVPPPETGYWVAGRLHAPGLSATEAADLAQTLTREPPPWPDLRVVTLHGEPHFVSIEPLDSTGSAWKIHRASLAPWAARQRTLTLSLVAAGLGACLTALAVASWTSRRFAARFGRAVQRHEAQRARRVRVERNLEHTREERDRAARFAADASHQLKTPVAVLRSDLEELAAQPDFPAARLSHIDALVRSTENLGQIIDDLLLLARLDAGLIAAGEAVTDVDQLLAQALDDCSVYPGAESLTLENPPVTAARVRAEPRHVALIVQCLLENAVKYSPAGATLRTAVLDGGETWRIRFTNPSAVPLPELGDADRLFDRFHRGNAAHDRPGYGLGLSLARQLARLHGGDVRLVAVAEHSATFEVELRKA